MQHIRYYSPWSDSIENLAQKDIRLTIFRWSSLGLLCFLILCACSESNNHGQNSLINTVDGSVMVENQGDRNSDSTVSTEASTADRGVDMDAQINDSSLTFEDTGSLNDAMVVEDATVDVADASQDVIDADQGDAPGLECLWDQVFPTIGSKNLRAVWGSSEDDIYAVGDSGTMFHFDGNQWTKVNTDTKVDLLDIWGSGKDDIYVAGGTLNSTGGRKGYALLHFDGRSWNKVNLLFQYDSCGLNAVFGTSPNNVFVAGGCEAIWHFDGTSWHPVTPLEAHGGFWADIFSCGDGEVYAINENGGGIYRYNPDISRFEPEDRWNLQSSNPDYENLQYKILLGTAVCASPDDLWMVYDYFINESEPNSVYHWNGQRWNALDVEAFETAGQMFRAMYISPNDERYLIGDDGAMFWFDGRFWQSIDTGTRLRLNNMFSIDGSRLFVVGDLGIILDGTDVHFENLNQGAEAPFFSLLHRGTEELAAVTSSGDIVLGNGEDWEIFTNEDAEDFTARAATIFGENQILIGGSYFHILLGLPITQPGLFQYDGGRIEPVSMNISIDHAGVQCTEVRGFLPFDDELYVVCDNGDVLRKDGVFWRSVTPDTSCSMDIEATNFHIGYINIWGDAPDNFFIWGVGSYAYGSAPVMRTFGCRYNGTGWEEIPIDPMSIYNRESLTSVKAIWGSSGENYILYVDYTEDNHLDICAISIRRFDGVNTTLVAGCSSEAEVVFDPDSNEFAFSGPEDGFAIGVYDSSIIYNNSKWTIVPYGFETYGNAVGKPVVSFLDSQIYATTEGSIYRRDCDL